MDLKNLKEIPWTGVIPLLLTIVANRGYVLPYLILFWLGSDGGVLDADVGIVG
ncbi:hypothetical protein [Dissulfurispira thermophila]|uniref:hypothetical protein n=1 Tax=Dissulfurispira thermophila TaxID=2715679 RepID=UPI00193D2413|nr:hypothetical protein [Dissulfurispira thermophila]